MTDENKQEDAALAEESSAKNVSEKTKAPESDTPKIEKKPSLGFIYLLIFGLICLVLVAVYYFWEEQKKQNAQITQQVQTLSNLQSQLSDSQKIQKTSVDAASQNAQQIQVIVADLNNANEKAQQAIDLVNRSQRDWALAEVDYLLRMAHQRIEIAKDVKGAVAALKGADVRLNELADLKLFKVRKQIAKDIASLNAIQQVDVNGTVLSIDQSLAYLAELPFKSVQSAVQSQLVQSEPVQEATEKSFLDSVIETIKKIGDIKIHQRSVDIVDSGNQQRQVEQLLYAHLLGARLAILNYNQSQFIYELEQVSVLLEQYYETDDSRIKVLAESITHFKKIQLTADLPELTTAWDLLQKEILKPVEKMTQDPE